MPQSFLITGAAGFIGSHFALRHVALHPEDSVTVLDALTYAGNKSYLDPIISKISFQKGDIADTALVASLVAERNIDTIVNFAAETHVDRSIADAHPFLHTNVLGTQSLIEVCRQHPVRLLHVSTDEVYGDLTDTERPKRTDDALKPSSPYAASKAAADLLVLAAVRTHGVKAAISRCTNNFGPHQADEKFIPTVIRAALQGKSIPIYAEGKNMRDWLYVTDHCDAIETMLASPDTFEGSKIFHVSADSEKRNIDVAKTILKILGKPESLLTFVKDRPGHDWRYALDSSDTKKLGWKPSVSFEDGLKKTIEWYQAKA